MYLVIGRGNHCETLTILLVMYVIQCYSFVKSSNRTRPEGTHRIIGVHCTIFGRIVRTTMFREFLQMLKIYWDYVHKCSASLRMLIKPTVGTVVLNTNAVFDDLLRWRPRGYIAYKYLSDECRTSAIIEFVRFYSSNL